LRRQLAQSADDVQGPWQRAGRHKCLGDYKECHTDQERDRGPEDDKPQIRQDALSRAPGGDDGGDDRGGDHKGEDSGDQGPQEGQAQAEQSANTKTP